MLEKVIGWEDVVKFAVPDAKAGPAKEIGALTVVIEPLIVDEPLPVC